MFSAYTRSLLQESREHLPASLAMAPARVTLGNRQNSSRRKQGHKTLCCFDLVPVDGVPLEVGESYRGFARLRNSSRFIGRYMGKID